MPFAVVLSVPPPGRQAGGAAAQPRAGRSTGTCGPRRAHTVASQRNQGKTVAWLMIPQRLSSLDVPTLKEVMTAQEATPRDGDEQSAARAACLLTVGGDPDAGEILATVIPPSGASGGAGGGRTRTTMRTLYPDLEEPEGGELTPDERALLREEAPTSSGGILQAVVSIVMSADADQVLFPPASAMCAHSAARAGTCARARVRWRCAHTPRVSSHANSFNTWWEHQ